MKYARRLALEGLGATLKKIGLERVIELSGHLDAGTQEQIEDAWCAVNPNYFALHPSQLKPPVGFHPLVRPSRCDCFIDYKLWDELHDTPVFCRYCLVVLFGRGTVKVNKFSTEKFYCLCGECAQHKLSLSTWLECEVLPDPVKSAEEAVQVLVATYRRGVAQVAGLVGEDSC